MPATITPLLTNVTLANNNTGFVVTKLSAGGQTPTAVSEADVYIQGGGACSVKVSGQDIVLWFNNGSGIDLTGQIVYIWCNMLALGLTDTIANGGLSVALGSSTSNYNLYAVGGNDSQNYPGGWARFAIDPSKTATSTGGSGLTVSSCQYFGMRSKTLSAAKFDNLVIDRIDYGTGLRISGTSTADDTMGDALAEDEGNSTNRYGILRSDNGIIYCKGLLRLGSTSGASSLTDKNKVIVFEQPKYYQGGSLQDAIDAVDVGVIVDDGASANTTDITIGAKVGSGDTATGSNGWTVLTGGHAAAVDFTASNASSDVQVYGSIFRGLGQISLPDTGTGEWVGNTVDDCAQAIPATRPIRGSIFSGFTPTSDGALLWVSGIDIKNCRFLNNTRAIEHDTAADVTYDGLIFGGSNTYDVYLSAGSGTLNVTPQNGADPVNTLADGTGVINIISGNVPVLVIVRDDSTGSLLQYARVRLNKSSDKSQILSAETNASGEASTTFAYTSDVAVEGWARQMDLSGTDYTPKDISGTITSDGLTIEVRLSPISTF